MHAASPGLEGGLELAFGEEKRGEGEGERKGGIWIYLSTFAFEPTSIASMLSTHADFASQYNVTHSTSNSHSHSPLT